VAAPASPGGGRLRSVDIIRGLACVLMAIDHVRVYSGLPAGGPTPGIFLTRWVTHFVAPVFALFAGTGAFFLGRRLGSPSQLARFLVARGLLLVALELTVIRLAWTYNFHYTQFVLAGVIWMLGWCMVLLAALVRLPARIVGWIGVAIVVFQSAFAFPPNWLSGDPRIYAGFVWEFIYPSGNQPWPGMAVLFVIVPWVGVMAAGYGLGALLQRDEASRRRLLLRIGMGFTVLFLVIGSVMVARSAPPRGGSALPFWMRLLNQQKYPASVPFLLMTLGPMIALMPWAERAKGFVADTLNMFGRVPLFYYLLHIPVIHAAGLVTNYLREGAFHQEWHQTAPYNFVPPEHRWPLWLLYVVYAIVLGGVLYPSCRWYARYKATHHQRWLRFI
jgi:uncharacterized membrane protein